MSVQPTPANGLAEEDRPFGLKNPLATGSTPPTAPLRSSIMREESKESVMSTLLSPNGGSVQLQIEDAMDVYGELCSTLKSLDIPAEHPEKLFHTFDPERLHIA